MAQSNKPEWKNTLNLPKTDFPMKARLNEREPRILARWEEMDLYNRILEKRKASPPYILHDGPPYANGHIHLGHALNKILKDFVVKAKSMEGFRAPYVPGWDCHGLPIEHKVAQELGDTIRDMDINEIRKRCRNYAEKFLDVQRKEFRRLGILGEWDTPYTTLDYSYEASVIEYLKSFVDKGNLYRRKRPVFWCISCETALAEAEVEYADHVSDSITVKFPLTDIPEFLSAYKSREIHVLIWTTTPWTIPANLAIAVHPDFDYSLFEMNNELYIAASRLVPVIADQTGAEFKRLLEFKGARLKGVKTRHPLYERDSLLINTDYVLLDQGTGCVHTAPGHGEEDYWAGLENGLDIYSPVGPSGRFDASTGKYQGQEVFAANPVITEDLRRANRLIHSDSTRHSYPHCWRCKNPIVFRATEQWFISMDETGLRGKALEAITGISWIPDWGEDRIYKMVENRPDWCISRQRSWGVPIPVFYCRDCAQPLLDSRVIMKVKDRFQQEGSDSWYSHPPEFFIPDGTTCAACDGSSFKKGNDIVDVWFESGSSFNILDHYAGHRFPADMYLEGGDQYRGWFHSSLLVALSARQSSPYKTVITHGFTLDHEGRAMSKSLGNVIDPLSIINEKGAEVLRLWVAMVNYREDVRLGDELLSRITESYRNIRNRWRFMLGVISDFNPETDSLPEDQLREVDRYILSRLEEVKERILAAYTQYEYHTIYHTLSNFFTVDLSTFYLNFIKDNLYCNAVSSPERRGAQTALFAILHDTLLLMAPILSFTSEEAWEFMPPFKGKESSIHLHRFPAKVSSRQKGIDLRKWDRIMTLREQIMKELENARNQKTIGDSLEAIVRLELPGDLFALASSESALFEEILVVSGISISKAQKTAIQIEKSAGAKCPRCWKRFTGQQPHPDYPDLCPRCAGVVEGLTSDV